jgi:hypothetical protein
VRKVKETQILKEMLTRKGILDKGDFIGKKKDILESLRPANFLTSEELKETEEALRNLQLPQPTGWAHAMAIHATRQSMESFSPNRSYCCDCLIQLQKTLQKTDLKNRNIFKKLATAVQIAERYGVENCLF